MDVALTSYTAALEYLFARTTGGWKLGLERTVALLDALGNPHHRYPVLHVAGTNGKGSVVATLDALLRAGGWRVGRYTSPHLVDFRERIVVDGQPMPEQAVSAWVERWTPTVERLGATFFEATTAMALDYFGTSALDVAVVEVGLGGRLDSTNVVTPLVAAVTTIGLDHTDWLGDTLERIAVEKAGIFKAGRAAAIGERDPALRALLARCAREARADPVFVLADAWRVERVDVTAAGTSFDLVRAAARRRLRTALVGEHQAANAALALAVLELAGEPFAAAAREPAAGLAAVSLPGRFHRAEPFIFDVAHNAPGADVLARTLAAVRPPRPLVALVGVLADKDWRSILAALAPHVDRFVLTQPPTAPADRAWDVAAAHDHAARAGYAVVAEPDFDRALELAREGAATTLVTGSFHTVGDAMARLQRSPDGR